MGSLVWSSRVHQLEAGLGHEVWQVHARLQADPENLEEWKVQAGDHRQQHPTSSRVTTTSSALRVGSTSGSAPSPSPTLGTATSSGRCLEPSQKEPKHKM